MITALICVVLLTGLVFLGHHLRTRRARAFRRSFSKFTIDRVNGRTIVTMDGKNLKGLSFYEVFEGAEDLHPNIVLGFISPDIQVRLDRASIHTQEG
jgi:hypothetical protein